MQQIRVIKLKQLFKKAFIIQKMFLLLKLRSALLKQGFKWQKKPVKITGPAKK